MTQTVIGAQTKILHSILTLGARAYEQAIKVREEDLVHSPVDAVVWN
jgi:hypothetical protein